MSRKTQHLWIDGRKVAVISARRKKNAPDILVVRTDVFGQFAEHDFDDVYTIQTTDQESCRAKLISWIKDIRIEKWEFEILE